MQRILALLVLTIFMSAGCVRDVDRTDRAATMLGGASDQPVAVDGMEWDATWNIRGKGIPEDQRFPVVLVAADIGDHVRLLPASPWLEIFDILAGEQHLPNPYTLPLEHGSLNPVRDGDVLPIFDGGGDSWVLRWSGLEWEMERTVKGERTIIDGTPRSRETGSLHIEFDGVPWDDAVFVMEDSNGDILAQLATKERDRSVDGPTGGYSSTFVGLGDLVQILDIDVTLPADEASSDSEHPFAARDLPSFSWTTTWCEPEDESPIPMDDSSRSEVDVRIEVDGNTLAGRYMATCMEGYEGWMYGDACRLQGEGSIDVSMQGQTSPLEQVAVHSRYAHFEWDRVMWRLDGDGQLIMVEDFTSKRNCTDQE